MFELKESDLPSLKKLATYGAQWVARDECGALWGYQNKPEKIESDGVWFSRTGIECPQASNKKLLCVQWSDPEPLNIAAAIAQIKAQKKQDEPVGMPYLQPYDDGGTIRFKAMRTKPLTWNERINQMTVEEKAKLLVLEWIHKDECVFVALDGRRFTDRRTAVEHNKTLLNSPCEGGEKE